MGMFTKPENPMNKNSSLNKFKFFTNKKVLACRAFESSIFEPDTQVALAGTVLGIVLGVGAPVFYASRDEVDEKRLQEIRALNRATKEATGEYMSEQELYNIRPPRWTDRREFLDDD